MRCSACNTYTGYEAVTHDEKDDDRASERDKMVHQPAVPDYGCRACQKKWQSDLHADKL